jgi:hypothetical protein
LAASSPVGARLHRNDRIALIRRKLSRRLIIFGFMSLSRGVRGSKIASLSESLISSRILRMGIIHSDDQVIRNDPMTLKDAYEISKTWVVSTICSVFSSKFFREVPF